MVFKASSVRTFCGIDADDRQKLIDPLTDDYGVAMIWLTATMIACAVLLLFRSQHVKKTILERDLRLRKDLDVYRFFRLLTLQLT